MIKKLVVILVLLISLFGCSSKSYTVESVDYKAILPSVENEGNYELLGFNDSEVFVAYNEPVCKIVKEYVTTDDGTTVTTEEVDSEVCTQCAVTIYAIDRETKGYRVVEQGFENHYIFHFHIVDDVYYYGLYWYEPETGVNTVDYYLDDLDASNLIFADEYTFWDGKRTVVGFVQTEDMNYVGVREDNNFYIHEISKEVISEKLVATNVDKQEYSYMFTTPYVLIHREDHVEIYSILDEKSYQLVEPTLSQVISVVDNKVYGYDGNGLCVIDLQTNQKNKIDKQSIAYTKDYLLFEDELWYIENDQYKKMKVDYEFKDRGGFYTYQDQMGILTSKGIEIVKVK